jgi:hypothetical protein
VPLAIGDTVRFAGATGTVVAVTGTTDANGRGFIAYNGQTFNFRVLKALPDGATEFPWVATNDADWRMGLLEHPGQDLYCLVSDDPPAPGWGRWIQQDRWREASDFASQDSVVFVLGWRPGTITIKKGGVVQEGVYADLMMVYSTDLDGTCEAWWQPAYPYGDPPKGRFRTDANGRLWDVITGANRHIIVPRGFAALGQRAADTWPGMGEPERLLAELRVCYRQESTVVREATAAELDIRACSLAITGPPLAQYKCFWEAGPVRGNGALHANGQTTVHGLPPGTYVVDLSPSTGVLVEDWLPRKTVVLAESGGEYQIDFPNDFNHFTTTGHVAGTVFADAGLVPAAGAEVQCWYDGTWHVEAVLDTNGSFNIDATPFQGPGEVALKIQDPRGCLVD